MAASTKLKRRSAEMSNGSDSAPKADFDGPADLVPGIDKARDLLKFLRTRAAVLRGDPLYNLTNAELDSRRLMKPLPFNAMQSTLCAIPGMLIAAYAWLAHGSVIVSTPSDPVQEKIDLLLRPLGPPFTLLIVVCAVAYFSLPVGHKTSTNWKAAQRKYLYLDGAHGFWPQFAMAFCVGLISLVATDNKAGTIRSSIAIVLFAFTLLWQIVVTEGKVKGGLIHYDYLDVPNVSSANEPSFLKFNLFLGASIWIGIFLLQSALYLISVVLTFVVHRIF
jgi:hypothetical protein